MQRKKYLMRYILSFLLFGISTSSFAYQYGLAGCGIGALVFEDKTGKIQLVAATLNGISSHQTSALSSGTSNCYVRKTKSLIYILNPIN